MPTGAMPASDRNQPPFSIPPVSRALGPTGAIGADPNADALPDPLAPVLQRASQGDPDAWRQIVNLYSRRIYALARSRLAPSGGAHKSCSARSTGRDGGLGTGDDAAEEVTQSVFVTVASKLASGGYTERGRFESWLFRVAMNRVRDEARRRKRQAEPTDPASLGQSLHAVDSHDDPTDRAALFSHLCLAMDQLSETDREIIELRHHGGMSFKAMADVLDEPVGTLLARHHRALRKLKDLLPAAVRAVYEDLDQPDANPNAKGATA